MPSQNPRATLYHPPVLLASASLSEDPSPDAAARAAVEAACAGLGAPAAAVVLFELARRDRAPA